MIQSIRHWFGLWAVAVIVLLMTSCAHLASDTGDWNEFTNSIAVPSELDLHYEESGSGAPILFLHGFAVTSFTWRHLVPSLSEKYRVILLDLKGFGESPKPKDGKYSLYDQARLVVRFIEKHDLRHLTIIGHSYGGGVALITSLYLQKKAPGRLRRLILIDAISYPQELPQLIKIITTPVIGPIAVTLVPKRRQARSLLKLAYYDDEKIPEDAVEAYSEPLRAPGAKHAVLKTAKQIIPSDLESLAERYKQLTLPVLIIWGSEDEIVPISIGTSLANDIPNSTFVVFDQTGHVPHEEKPGDTLKIINQFLNKT